MSEATGGGPATSLTSRLFARVDPMLLVIEGELDVLTASAMSYTIDAALESPGRLEVDLAGIRFIDSQGVNALCAARERHGRRMYLGDRSESVRRILALTGCDGAFDP